MDETYKPITEYYKNKEYVIPSNYKNTTILHRIEKDVSQLQTDINQLKEDIRYIRNYITIKKERENNRWF